MKIYSAIKQVTNRKSKSIASIERALNLSAGSICKWNKSMPGADRLQDVADYLGVTTKQILDLARKEV